MSGEVEGVYYPSLADYRRALSERNARHASRQAAALRGDYNRFEAQARATQAELSNLRGDVRRQAQLTEALGGQVKDLRQCQNRLREVQQNMQAEMDRNFAEAQREIDATQEDLVDLEREHNRHVREVQAQFADLESEMQLGFAEAEERRQESERRLRHEIKKVDDKLEADRQALLNRQRSELDRAGKMCELVEEQIALFADQAEPLDLESDIARIREGLATARRLHRQGDAPTSLAASESAYAAARHLYWDAGRRGDKLKIGLRKVVTTLEEFCRKLDNEHVRKYFAGELGLAERKIRELESDVAKKYQRYATLEIDTREHERVLELLRRDIDAMEAAPEVHVQYEKREKRILELLKALADVCGPMTAPPKPDFASAGDPKSARLIWCNFATGKVVLHVPLSETEHFDLQPFGHSSNRDCQELLQRVTARLGGIAVVTRSVSDDAPREAPRLPASAASSARQLH